MTKILIGSMSIVAVVAMGSCTSDVTCGTGTIEKDGECIADGTPIHGNCGAGSKFNPVTQQCEITACNGAASCGICGENTVPVTAADGTVSCVGTGGGDCGSEPPCPPPDSGRQMICGRLVDTETGALVTADVSGTVKVSFYEALAFANNAQTPPEFSVFPDKCGRYVSSVPGHNGVAVPGTMFILIGTDDQTTAFPNGDFITTGVVISGVSGGQKAGLNTYLTRAQTDTDWSTSAGLTGASFVEQGVYMAIFVDTSKTAVPPLSGAPAAMVTLNFAGATDAAHDYYFDDASQLIRSSVGTGDVTGMNGTVLFTPSASMDLETYKGIGPTGCDWGDGVLGATIPNTVFVQEHPGTCP